MALALAVDVHINVDEVLVRTLLKALDHNGNAVGHLLPQEEQRFLAHQLCHQLLFRHIGEGIIVKVVRAFVAVGLEHGKQILTACAVLS